MPEKFTFTAAKIEALPLPTADRAMYYDADLPGFAIRVYRTGRRVFYVVKRSAGSKPRFYCIGPIPPLTVKEARERARKLLLQLIDGTDPRRQAEADKAAKTTLNEAFERYLTDRDLKPGTVTAYRQSFYNYLADWLEQPLTAITREAILNRFDAITKTAGPGAANQALTILRAVWNYAQGIYETADGRPLLDYNPVSKLTALRRWHRLERRRRTIPTPRLKDWFEAVNRQNNAIHRDYVLFVLFTGLRRNEAARLQWEDVDTADRSFLIRDTKTRKQLRLPLSDVTAALLDRADRSTAWVFPNRYKDGPLTRVDEALYRITQATGIEFSLHDLRRTFASACEACGIPPYTIKALLNHAVRYSDVTGGYVVVGIDRLREPMQQVADYLKAATGFTPTADRTGNIIPLRRA